MTSPQPVPNKEVLITLLNRIKILISIFRMKQELDPNWKTKFRKISSRWFWSSLSVFLCSMPTLGSIQSLVIKRGYLNWKIWPKSHQPLMTRKLMTMLTLWWTCPPLLSTSRLLSTPLVVLSLMIILPIKLCSKSQLQVSIEQVIY